jgi:hypothetical protein
MKSATVNSDCHRKTLARYRPGRSRHWIKTKNPAAPAVKREAEEDWGRVTPLTMQVA